MEFGVFIELFRSGGSIVVNKEMMKKIGVEATIIYSELVSRFVYFQKRDMLTEDGFFYNTVDDLESATTFKEKAQKTAIDKLVGLGLIEKK